MTGRGAGVAGSEVSSSLNRVGGGCAGATGSSTCMGSSLISCLTGVGEGGVARGVSSTVTGVTMACCKVTSTSLAGADFFLVCLEARLMLLRVLLPLDCLCSNNNSSNVLHRPGTNISPLVVVVVVVLKLLIYV
uniref:Uncharacterized protein n=1 Tax=Cacopsylla melanoneura TaxID=428564 RepID=A0A8D8RUU8_9HEMI